MRFLTFITVFFVFEIQVCFGSAEKVKKKIDGIVAQLEIKYRVKLVYSEIPSASWKEVSYQELEEQDNERLLNFIELFAEEFNKYPRKFIDTTNIQYVAFVKNLKYMEQERNALPDPYMEVLYFDIFGCLGVSKHISRWDRIYTRHTIHHEFFHMIEEQIHGSMYYQDSIWIGFNPDSFSYIGSGADYYDKIDVYIKKYKKAGVRPYFIYYISDGFATLYACSALEEDRAELYAALFNRVESKRLKKFCRMDEIVAKKTLYMKKYIESLCGSMDETYWKIIK